MKPLELPEHLQVDGVALREGLWEGGRPLLWTLGRARAGISCGPPWRAWEPSASDGDGLLGAGYDYPAKKLRASPKLTINKIADIGVFRVKH